MKKVLIFLVMLSSMLTLNAFDEVEMAAAQEKNQAEIDAQTKAANQIAQQKAAQIAKERQIADQRVKVKTPQIAPKPASLQSGFVSPVPPKVSSKGSKPSVPPKPASSSLQFGSPHVQTPTVTSSSKGPKLLVPAKLTSSQHGSGVSKLPEIHVGRAGQLPKLTPTEIALQEEQAAKVEEEQVAAAEEVALANAKQAAFKKIKDNEAAAKKALVLKEEEAAALAELEVIQAEEGGSSTGVPGSGHKSGQTPVVLPVKITPPPAREIAQQPVVPLAGVTHVQTAVVPVPSASVQPSHQTALPTRPSVVPLVKQSTAVGGGQRVSGSSGQPTTIPHPSNVPPHTIVVSGVPVAGHSTTAGHGSVNQTSQSRLGKNNQTLLPVAPFNGAAGTLPSSRSNLLADQTIDPATGKQVVKSLPGL